MNFDSTRKKVGVWSFVDWLLIYQFLMSLVAMLADTREILGTTKRR